MRKAPRERPRTAGSAADAPEMWGALPRAAYEQAIREQAIRDIERVGRRKFDA